MAELSFWVSYFFKIKTAQKTGSVCV